MGNVRSATVDDLDEVAGTLADAFTGDPVMAWAFPDLVTRPRRLQTMFGYLAEHLYLPLGRCSVDIDAATLWLPSGFTGAEGFWVEHGEAFAVALEGQLERLAALGTAMRAHHPGGPHAYLLAIGVRPSAQGRGVGGTLLAHDLAQVDERGEAAYLEATSLRSRVLYERHGFEVVAEIRADDSPPLWPMWRPAR